MESLSAARAGETIGAASAAAPVAASDERYFLLVIGIKSSRSIAFVGSFPNRLAVSAEASFPPIACGSMPEGGQRQHLSAYRAKQDDKSRRRFPHEEQEEGGDAEGKIACARDARRPRRIIQRRQQQADDGGVHAPQRRLGLRAAAQVVPEWQWADHQQEGWKKHGDEAQGCADPPIGRRSHDRAEIG